MVQGLARQRGDAHTSAGLMDALPLRGVKSFAATPHLPVWLPPLLSLLAGWLQAVSIATPWDGQPLWWLQLVSMGLLAWLVDRTPGWRPAAFLGWLFALAWLSGTFWWLFIAMHTYGGLPAPLTVLAVLALAGLLALYYAAACGIFVMLVPTRKHGGAVLFAVLWMAAEMARGRWFTGFGWGASGYAHTEGPLAGYAPWLGMYGLCALSAWLAMTVPRLVAAGLKPRISLLGALLVLALASLYPMAVGPEMTRPAGRLSVTLLQGNIPQDEKFQLGSGVAMALQWYTAQWGKSQSELVVAPETAIPLLPQQLPPGYWTALEQRFSSGQQAALVGVPLGSYKEGYTNSVIGLKPGQAEPWRYDKHHLVPFGEFIPPFFKWFTEMMNIPLGDFNRGEVGQASFEWKGQRLALNICYEDLFGEELGARFVEPSRAPTIFVNASNIAWFGNTVAIDQHLNISRMRALEFERPFIRATNTGATVIIDHQGRVTASLQRHTQGALTGEVEGRTGTTPYAWWVSRYGLWPLWGMLVIVLWGALRRQRPKQ
jgi:apolipoprotein N-acyltransferase